MNLGIVFLLITLAIFFVIGIGALPVPIVWGFFTLTLGLLLLGVPAPWSGK